MRFVTFLGQDQEDSAASTLAALVSSGLVSDQTASYPHQNKIWDVGQVKESPGPESLHKTSKALINANFNYIKHLRNSLNVSPKTTLVCLTFVLKSSTYTRYTQMSILLVIQQTLGHNFNKIYITFLKQKNIPMTEWTMIVHIYMHLHIPDKKNLRLLKKTDQLALLYQENGSVVFKTHSVYLILDYPLSQILLQGINCYFHYSNLPFLINYKWKAIVRT